MSRSLLICTAILLPSCGNAEGIWIDLLEPANLGAFKGKHGKWYYATEVAVDPSDPKKLKGTPGGGTIIVNGPGKTDDLVTNAKFGDCEFECEFLVPKGSNSGVKMHGLYEIQIFDSWGAKKLTGKDCGGIYPRAELTPSYHHIDDGIAPSTNACKPPGEWQRLEITFKAPRFNLMGKRTEQAEFVVVKLNGKTVHDRVKLEWPTGHAWHRKEMSKGPILIQADHGPVAYRNVRVKEIDLSTSK